MKLAFSKRLRYCRNEGFRTPEKSLPFLLLEGSDGEKHKMVGLVGLEPTTKGL